MNSGNPPEGPALDRPDRVDSIVAFLAPTVEEILRRLDGSAWLFAHAPPGIGPRVAGAGGQPG